MFANSILLFCIKDHVNQGKYNIIPVILICLFKDECVLCAALLKSLLSAKTKIWESLPFSH